jgi:hypothetical protein
VTTSKVADGIYLFQTSRYGDVGFGGNAVAILTDDGVVMFDSSGTPASAHDSECRSLRSISSKCSSIAPITSWNSRWQHSYLSSAKEERDRVREDDVGKRVEAELAKMREVLAADEDFLQQKRSVV